MTAVAIILINLIVAVKLFFNYRQHLKKQNTVTKKSYVNHGLEWCIMVLAAAPAIYFLRKNIEIDVFAWHWLNEVAAYLLPAAMCAMYIWLFFDGLFNIVRKHGFFFTGSDDVDDAASDNFLQSIPLWLHVVIKVGGLGATVFLYVKCLN